MIRAMSGHLAKTPGPFNAQRFVKVATTGLDELELKERSHQIVRALDAALPADFQAACDTLLAALHPSEEDTLPEMVMDSRGIRGWGIMPMADYVALHGLEHFDLSMDVLAEMTKRSTSEFAVRPFLAADQKRALRHVKKWSKSRNVHVRRLASEGTRPRLPWGMQLRDFVADPAPLLPILEHLRDDEDEYVRRSVANNINDIAKDHPALVADLAKTWLKGATTNRARLVRHACRTLIKRGHAPTLKALGYGPAQVAVEHLTVSPAKVRVGDSIQISLTLRSESKRPQPLLVDYAVHHQKSGGKTSPKVFKWKTLTLAPGETATLEKKHSFKPVTTRKYYPGPHEIEIMVNGKSVGSATCDLKVSRP